MPNARLALVESAVMRFLAQRQRTLGVSATVDADVAVFESGLLDSMALVELVAAVEAEAGVSLDMLRFDPTEAESAGALVAALGEALEPA